jgi:phosphohistidine phosphatase
MLILLVRHAQAAERDSDLYPDDSLRPLVGRGRRTQARVSRHLARHRLIPTEVLSSPWRRAWQTATILVRETGIGKKRRIACPALAEEPRLDRLAEAVGPRKGGEIVALVGHEPWLGELAGLLLTGSGARPEIDFPKSGIIGIEAPTIGPAAGTLRFFLTPDSV